MLYQLVPVIESVLNIVTCISLQHTAVSLEYYKKYQEEVYKTKDQSQKAPS